MSKSRVFEWYKPFEENREDLKDDKGHDNNIEENDFG